MSILPKCSSASFNGGDCLPGYYFHICARLSPLVCAGRWWFVLRNETLGQAREQLVCRRLACGELIVGGIVELLKIDRFQVQHPDNLQRICECAIQPLGEEWHAGI